MKKFRFLVFIAVLIMLFPVALAEQKFSYDNARDAKLKALDCLMESAFQAEYGDNRNAIIRWEKPLYIYVAGKPSDEDSKVLNDFLLELQLKVLNLPNIYIVNKESQANFKIYYIAMKDFKKYGFSDNGENWGLFSYWYDNNIIDEVKIALAIDKTNQLQRKHLMMEEIVGGLGLTNDHYIYSDSIVYQPWTETQKLSEVDWLMLNMLYSDRIQVGMNKDRVKKIFESLIYEQ